MKKNYAASINYCRQLQSSLLACRQYHAKGREYVFLVHNSLFTVHSWLKSSMVKEFSQIYKKSSAPISRVLFHSKVVPVIYLIRMSPYGLSILPSIVS